MSVPDQLLTAHRSLLTAKIAPMLAYSSKPFDSVKHLFEIKWDGPATPLGEVVKGVQWVRPQLRCRVSFQEMTPRGHFRAPAFERLLREEAL